MTKERKIIDMVENRITEHQLSKIQGFEENLEKGKNFFGGLSLQYEFQKSSLLSQIAKIDEEYSKFRADLKDQYGEIDIDVSTGVYTHKETKGE
ncbi:MULTISPECIES: hypothetical protein [Flavobacteriaceae]|uniref:hypothetical protein n=1 Tax=Flavobacteriaceae TaxID=49546 RepID=UPI0025DEF2CE|nr:MULTISPECIES: hypothetical protein [Flavobacteriaceae]